MKTCLTVTSFTFYCVNTTVKVKEMNINIFKRALSLKHNLLYNCKRYLTRCLTVW